MHGNRVGAAMVLQTDVDDDAGTLLLHSARGRLALVATVAASAMAMLDATVVNVAVPRIGEEFDAGVGALQWVLTGYLLALSSLILLGGALGDRYGRRKVFVVGTIWFAAASALCAISPNVEMLVGARILQGVGGALLTPGSLAILQASFRSDDRAAAVGAWSGLGGVAGAVGPLIGGALVDGPGWRWAFVLNLPVAAIVVGCAHAAIPETRDVHATNRLDVPGAALVAVALAASTWALTEAGTRGWTNGPVLVSCVVAIVTTAMFVRRMLQTEHPLVPPSLFRNRTFTVVNVATFLLYGAIGVSFFLVAYELQVAAGWSALEAGLALLPATLLMLVLSASSGSLAQRIGPRLQLTVGPLLVGGGLVLLTRIGPRTSWWSDVLPGAVLFGLGLVTLVAPLTATVMAAADPDHVSIASGVNNAIARTAALASIALIPGISGLSVARGAGEVTHAFRISIVITACLAAAAAPIVHFGCGARVRVGRTPRHMHCAVDGAPLQPDPRRCA